jgi:hypothetical protein
MVIAWNENAPWSAESGGTAEDAGTDAVAACNQKNGKCTLAVSLKSTEFMCVKLRTCRHRPWTSGIRSKAVVTPRLERPLI